MRPKKKKLPIRITKATSVDMKKLDGSMNFHLKPLPSKSSRSSRMTLVAKHEGQIVGFMELSAKPTFGRKQGTIHTLSVRKGYKGMGIGSRLLGRANSHFIKEGFERVLVRPGFSAKKYWPLHTNYSLIEGSIPTEYEWRPKKKSPRKKPIQSQPSHQNAVSLRRQPEQPNKKSSGSAAKGRSAQ